MDAPSLTPALALQAEMEDAAWRDIFAKLERLAELEKSRPLLPENERRLIEAMAPFLEVRRSSVLDDGAVLADLQKEDPARYREVMVAVLDEDERAALAKFGKAHHSRSQMRDDAGKFRASFFRRADARPRFGGKFF